MTEHDRFELMAVALQETSRTVAHQAGELQAMFLLLHGILAFEAVSPGTHQKLHSVLEHCAASNLHQPVSDEFLRGFLGRIELLKGSLKVTNDNFGTHLMV